MKKLVYTLSFVALVGLTAKAQDHKQDPAPAKKEANPNQHVVTPTAPANSTPVSSEPGEPKSRMAITQKGVPASKAKETKEAKPAETKGQPTPAEKH